MNVLPYPSSRTPHPCTLDPQISTLNPQPSILIFCPSLSSFIPLSPPPFPSSHLSPLSPFSSLSLLSPLSFLSLLSHPSLLFHPLPWRTISAERAKLLRGVSSAEAYLTLYSHDTVPLKSCIKGFHRYFVQLEIYVRCTYSLRQQNN